MPHRDWDEDEDDRDAPQPCDLDADSDDDTVDCPQCGAAIHEDAPRCPECGHWVENETPARTTSGGMLWAVIVALLIAVILVFWHGLGR